MQSFASQEFLSDLALEFDLWVRCLAMGFHLSKTRPNGQFSLARLSGPRGRSMRGARFSDHCQPGHFSAEINSPTFLFTHRIYLAWLLCSASDCAGRYFRPQNYIHPISKPIPATAMAAPPNRLRRIVEVLSATPIASPMPIPPTCRTAVANMKPAA